MKILNDERRTGKTTECIRVMRENPDAIMFVMTNDMAKSLPKDIQDRVFSINSCSWIGRKFKKAVLDNIGLMETKSKTIQKIQGAFEIILVTATFSPKVLTQLFELFGDTEDWGYCPDCDRPDCDNCDERMGEPMRNEGYD